MKQSFVAMILGGTGQVGRAAVAQLLAIPECREVMMITRKPIAARSRVRNVVLDTGAADFAALIHMTTTAKSGVANATSRVAAAGSATPSTCLAWVLPRRTILPSRLSTNA